MDAPQSQYRVIERGGRLIVLEASTNQQPKQARDLMPSRAGVREAPRDNRLVELLERKGASTGLEGSARQPSPPAHSEGKSESASVPQISIAQIAGIAIFMIAVAIMAGGITGFFIAAIVLTVAGNLSLKRIGKNRR